MPFLAALAALSRAISSLASSSSFFIAEIAKPTTDQALITNQLDTAIPESERRERTLVELEGKIDNGWREREAEN